MRTPSLSACLPAHFHVSHPLIRLIVVLLPVVLFRRLLPDGSIITSSCLISRLISDESLPHTRIRMPGSALCHKSWTTTASAIILILVISGSCDALSSSSSSSSGVYLEGPNVCEKEEEYVLEMKEVEQILGPDVPDPLPDFSLLPDEGRQLLPFLLVTHEELMSFLCLNAIAISCPHLPVSCFSGSM